MLGTEQGHQIARAGQQVGGMPQVAIHRGLGGQQTQPPASPLRFLPQHHQLQATLDTTPRLRWLRHRL